MSDLIQLFADELGVDAAILDEESSPESVSEWDSLAAMRLVAAIEETYGIELSTGEIMKMRSIALARSVLRNKGISV